MYIDKVSSMPLCIYLSRKKKPAKGAGNLLVVLIAEPEFRWAAREMVKKKFGCP